MMRMDIDGKGRTYEDTRSFSPLRGLEPPLKPFDVNYHSYSAPLTAISHGRNLPIPASGSSRDLSTDDRGSNLARSRSRSPISKHGEPSSAISMPDDVRHGRRLRDLDAVRFGDFPTDHYGSVFSVPLIPRSSPVAEYGVPSFHSSASSALDDVSHQSHRCLEAGFSKELLTDHGGNTLSVPSFDSRSPDFIFGELSWRHSDAGGSERQLGSCSSTTEQSASGSKHQHHHQQQQPQPQPTCSNSSLLFSQKLAKLRQLR